MTAVLKYMSPMKRIKLDRLSAISDMFDEMEEEIRKLKAGLEVHGGEEGVGEWEWWDCAVQRSKRLREEREHRRLAKRAAKEEKRRREEVGRGKQVASEVFQEREEGGAGDPFTEGSEGGGEGLEMHGGLSDANAGEIAHGHEHPRVGKTRRHGHRGHGDGGYEEGEA
jgi:hypothetical protein